MARKELQPVESGLGAKFSFTSRKRSVLPKCLPIGRTGATAHHAILLLPKPPPCTAASNAEPRWTLRSLALLRLCRKFSAELSFAQGQHQLSKEVVRAPWHSLGWTRLASQRGQKQNPWRRRTETLGKLLEGLPELLQATRLAQELLASGAAGQMLPPLS